MNYASVKKLDIANGLGVRVSLFVSGCTHHCKGCFNAETWDFNYGKKYTAETETEILEALKPKHIAGFSLLGGEPFEPQNQEVLCGLLKKIKQAYPQKNVWCFTGYVFEKDLLGDSPIRGKYTEDMLKCIDILVDGEFIEEKRDLMLKFRGSANQRIIDVAQSLNEGKTVLSKLNE